jgi:RHS repeat-associated protein
MVMMIYFTGHEKESDLSEGIYTTEYRLYDARVGRWLSIDPLFEKYVGMSPYNYCMLNPLVMVDPDGRELYPSFDQSDELKSKDYDQWKANNAMTADFLELPDHEDIFFIAAHGTSDQFVLKDGTSIKSPSDFELYFLNDDNCLYYKNAIANKQTVIVLYSCSVGKGDNPIGKQLSKEFETLVFAPSENLYSTCTSNYQVYEKGLFFDTGGFWNVFYKGELMEQINGYDSRWFFDKFGENAVQLKDFLDGRTAEDLLNHYETLYQKKYGKNED